MSEKKEKVKSMFDSIAHSYDLLNHLLSAGIDLYWRRKAISYTGAEKDGMLLDVACGTGDFSTAARKYGVKNIIGADLSIEMLRLFNKKLEWSKGRAVQMAAEQLPVKPESVSNITVAFGVRNFYDIPAAFGEFRRILKPCGKVTVLEFRLPKNILVRSVYLFYFHHILPFVGKVISKDRDAYTYLPESVGEFDRKVNLSELFLASGFASVESHTLTFGIVQVVIATK